MYGRKYPSQYLLRALDRPQSVNHSIAYTHKDPTFPYVLQFASRCKQKRILITKHAQTVKEPLVMGQHLIMIVPKEQRYSVLIDRSR